MAANLARHVEVPESRPAVACTAGCVIIVPFKQIQSDLLVRR